MPDVLSKATLAEALAGARMKISFLRRAAVEAKDAALAQRLSAQETALKARSEALRAAAHAEWAASADILEFRFKSARDNLDKAIKQLEKGETAVRFVLQAAAAVDDILSVAGKLLV